jgi:putative ABC transport system ATP-binding protein
MQNEIVLNAAQPTVPATSVRTSAPAAATQARPRNVGQEIIKIESVVKTYETGSQQVQALKDVSLTVHKAEMVAIMSPSGCGKTTLLNCASGLDVVDAGTIHIAGANLAGSSPISSHHLRARNMGFVFHTYNLLPVLRRRNVGSRSSFSA